VNGIALALRALRQGERGLADDLTSLAERHRDDHEVHHVATDLAGWSREHVRRLADAAATTGLDLDRLHDDSFDGPFAPPERRPEQPPGPQPETGLLLLRDLRDAHLAATRSSLHWEMLAQAAQASRNDRLLALASSCHPQTLRQMRWTNTMIKNLSPQVLTSV
jgi:hypothetical protein